MPKKNRRSYSAILLGRLTDLSGNGKSLVSNRTLRESLGWDEEKYTRVRTELLSRGQVILGRGYGGSVGLASAPGATALSVFVSYAHADEEVKTELMKHLEPLRRNGLISTWHDRLLKAGDDWNKQISVNLEKADLILLIVSIDFINSGYCYDIELDRALERHTQNKALVIPIIARSCIWKTAPFASIQALPKDGQPVALWPNRDAALAAVADSIEEAAKGLLASR